ncbi:hypothetical protein [Botryobacter ruber]|uniref:hypothetical protein n=1 Tax=Botryobacter ruber TaxID=2171629 RepID=UPI000E0A35F3|nr:hypothetical protein [Botryobacter ruber]
MKNLFFAPVLKACALLIVFLSVSCKDDSEHVSPVLSNTEYSNAKYTIKNGFIQDGGAVDIFLDSEAEHTTHYNYNLILTDGTPVFEDNDVVSMNDGKIVISALLLSPGTAAFKTGVFEYDDWSDHLDLEEEDLIARYQNKYFFPLAMVFTDTDGDKNWQEETAALVTGGTIKVSGTAPNYTTEYDLILLGGKTLKGSFAGKFNIAMY